MKQIKARIKQKEWKYENMPLKCFICKVMLVDREYIFCRKCKNDIISCGKNPEDLIKRYEKQNLHRKDFKLIKLHDYLR